MGEARVKQKWNRGESRVKQKENMSEAMVKHGAKQGCSSAVHIWIF